VWDVDSFNLNWPSIKEAVPSFIKLNANSKPVETEPIMRKVIAKLET
jgi:hypothetical protein